MLMLHGDKKKKKVKHQYQIVECGKVFSEF